MVSSSNDRPDDPPLRAPAKPVVPRNPNDQSLGGGDGGGAGAGSPCNINEVAIVNSPNKTVIATLRPKDVLAVELVQGPPLVLEVRTQTGQTVGSITSAALPQLIACIRKGYRYDGVVQSIQGGKVVLGIHPQ